MVKQLALFDFPVRTYRIKTGYTTTLLNAENEEDAKRIIVEKQYGLSRKGDSVIYFDYGDIGKLTEHIAIIEEVDMSQKGIIGWG